MCSHVVLRRILQSFWWIAGSIRHFRENFRVSFLKSASVRVRMTWSCRRQRLCRDLKPRGQVVKILLVQRIIFLVWPVVRRHWFSSEPETHHAHVVSLILKILRCDQGRPYRILDLLTFRSSLSRMSQAHSLDWKAYHRICTCWTCTWRLSYLSSSRIPEFASSRKKIEGGEKRTSIEVFQEFLHFRKWKSI